VLLFCGLALASGTQLRLPRRLIAPRSPAAAVPRHDRERAVYLLASQRGQLSVVVTLASLLSRQHDPSRQIFVLHERLTRCCNTSSIVVALNTPSP
jgi:hypothetical protein